MIALASFYHLTLAARTLKLILHWDPCPAGFLRLGRIIIANQKRVPLNNSRFHIPSWLQLRLVKLGVYSTFY